MNKIENEIIAIGGNHHNLLGVVRTLGEKGIKSNIIVTNENKYAFVIKSKYVKKYKIIKENEDEILEALNEYKNLDKKPILIPTSDYAEYTIDKNLDELSKYFIVPNIDNTQGKVITLMNKFNQSILFDKYNLKTPKTEILNLKQEKDNKIGYPFILKPIISANGEKADIRICKNEEEFNKAKEELRCKKYKDILIQEFLDNVEECDLIGYCFGKDVYLPGIVVKERVYPPKKGTISYGKVIGFDKENHELFKLYSMLKDINYNGLIDIDLFKVKNEYYINEINFRNSGNAYIYSSQNINLAYMWVCESLDKEISMNNINEEFYFIDEYLERSQLLNKNITIKEWFEAKRKASCYFVKNKKDIAPLIWKNIYAILKRINK